MPLRKLPKAFGLFAKKTWYPHNFNTKANLNYVIPMPDKSEYGYDNMSVYEREAFLAWYEERKGRVFDNRRVLEQYCQDDVTVLWQGCQTFRHFAEMETRTSYRRV
jgi:hypothetical protein